MPLSVGQMVLAMHAYRSPRVASAPGTNATPARRNVPFKRKCSVCSHGKRAESQAGVVMAASKRYFAQGSPCLAVEDREGAQGAQSPRLLRILLGSGCFGVARQPEHHLLLGGQWGMRDDV